MERAGYELIDLRRWDGTDELFQWEVPLGSVDDGTDERCYRTHLGAVDRQWQADVLSRHPEIDQTRQVLAACATEFGIAVDDSATAQEIGDAIVSAGHDYTECLP